MDEQVKEFKSKETNEFDEGDAETARSDDDDDDDEEELKEITIQALPLTMVNKKLEVGETSSKKRKIGQVTRSKSQSRKNEDVKKKVLDGHGSPAALYELINLLTASQKKDVEDIGFGGLLELKAKAFYHFMIDWLLDRYDHVSQMFQINEHSRFTITKHDVYDVFMLPCTEKTVKLASSKRKDNPDKELVQLWKNNFNAGPKGEISLDNLKAEMLKLVEGGADFKKMFVIFAMGTFLAPTVHNRVDLRLVTAVEDVAEIGQQDWCSYVLDRLNFAVKSWRHNNNKSVGGCLLFLQLVYFHRLTWRGSPAKSKLPLLQHWTYEGLKKRMSEEMQAYSLNGGHFGIGTWDHSTYPVSLFQSKRLYRLTDKEKTNSEGPISRYFKILLPDDVLSDEELCEKYPDIRLQKWMTTKRNLELVSRLHNHMARELEAYEEGLVQMKRQAVLPTGGDDIAQSSQIIPWTQALKDPNFLADFDALGRKIDEFIAKHLVEPSSLILRSK